MDPVYGNKFCIELRHATTLLKRMVESCTLYYMQHWAVHG